MESLPARVDFLARALERAGFSHSAAEVFEHWIALATANAGAGEPLLPALDPAQRRALFSALRAYERSGIYLVPPHDEALAPFIGLHAQTLAFVPLIAEARAVGALAVVLPPAMTDRDDVFTSLRAYADLAAMMLDRERSAVRSRRDVERSAVLSRIDERLRASLDRKVMIANVAGEARAAFGADRCVVYSRTPDGASVRIEVVDDPQSQALPIPEQFEIGGSFLETCFTQRRIVRVDAPDLARERPRLRALGVQSLLLTPVLVESGVKLVISLHYAQARTFDELDVLFMRAIAGYLGLALNSARLADEQRLSRHRGETLEGFVRRLTDASDAGAIARAACDAIVSEFNVCGALWEREGTAMVCRAVATRADAEHEFAVGARLTVTSARLDALVAGTATVSAGESDPFWRAVGAKERLVAPITIDGTVGGMLSARFGGEPGTSRESAEAFLRAVAAHAGLALRNVQALAEERRQVEERSVLSEAGRTILTHGAAETMARAIVEMLLGLLRSTGACIYASRSERYVLLADAGEGRFRPIVHIDDPLATEIFAGDVPVYLDNVDEMIGLAGVFDATTRHVAIVPLVAGDAARGAILCTRNDDDSLPYSADERRVLEALAVLVALGLRNADLIASERDARRALAESNSFKDDLLAMFAHDFRGPLTVIIGYCELALESATAIAPDGVARIHEQAQRLQKLSEDALTLAQTQANDFSVSREPLELLGFVRSAVEGLGPGRVTVQGPGDALVIGLDRARMRHVLENLVSNGLKYSDGPVTVTVSRVDGGAEIAVSDRGIGIPHEDLDLLFTRFGRGHEVRRRGIAGTGVGLYVARRIAEAHGGTIDVESKQGEGSTFTIRLPDAPLPMADFTEPAVRNPAPAIGEPERLRRRL